MKKQCLTALALLVTFTPLLAQKSESRNQVKINVFSPIVRTFSGFYERKISESSSLQLGVSYTGSKFDELKIRGFGITPEYRYYATNKGAMQGFYVAPFARFQHLNLKNESGSGTLNTLGGGLLLGNQWIFAKGISLDVFLGPSYNSGDVKVKSGESEFDIPQAFEGFGIRSGITLGIAF